MRPAFACVPAAGLEAALATLARQLGLPGEARFAGHDPHGRPRAEAGGRPLALSIARSGDLRALALAPAGRVGIDLVDPSAPLRSEALLELVSPRERLWLEALPPERLPRRLLQVWAGREALLKALGLGLALDPGAVELEPLGEEGLAPARVLGCGTPPEGWHLAMEEGEGLAAGLILALAWAD
jgi:4'-phosphopantetheinyl transferase